jgi:predicted ArsR family transcriptional regulator
MHDTQIDGQITAIAALDDPVRRSLYLYVAARGGAVEVGRDEAARAIKISRALAAFHLDKLVAAGLLEASYRRLTKRQGPGAGRPAKLYRRSARQFSVSLPQRNYELCSRVFAQALAGTRGATLVSVKRAARRLGRGLAAEARGPQPLRALATLLAGQGFEPQHSRGGVIRLGNCPFVAVTGQQGAIVCAATLALVEGMVAGLELGGFRACAVPQNGSCCVAVIKAGQGDRSR